MRDVAATIQAEQDRLIRSDASGILVIQGAPGTGKTAVGLHRAAYLLYSMRRELGRTGVLIVGPNRAFMRYVERVLPTSARRRSSRRRSTSCRRSDRTARTGPRCFG